VHLASLTTPEQRVLGCLIEKRFTTPDQYPLSLNALRLACNQSTNRDPVVSYDEATVREAAQRLSRYGVIRLASGHSSRSVKYRHLAGEALGLEPPALALLCVLLLRGPQTPGELKARTERMHAFGSPAALQEALGSLIERGYVRRLDRRPGQKEDRYEQLLGGGEGEPDTTAGAGPSPGPAPAIPRHPASIPRHPAAIPREPATNPSEAPGPEGHGRLEQRVEALERELAAIRAELRDLRRLLE
jgi:uncharacterized protein YceH (UPF0502 family)